MLVIAGLGNPGAEYAKTRHNVGFMAVDAFLKEHCGRATQKKTRAYTIIKSEFNGGEIAVVKPMMYMNLSGEALSRAPFNFRGGVDELLVVFDDASLGFGRLRFRPKGSAGGQKGMKNIIDTLGTDEINRLRIGIGRNEDMPLEDYVLRPFGRGEIARLNDVLTDAADAIKYFAERGIDEAMCRFNGTSGES